MSDRIFNFSPGPAMIPEEVLEIAKENLLSYQRTGLGIMEVSHRGPMFLEILDDAIKNLKSLLNISEDYAVIFTTGGATNQFSMVPMNLTRPDSIAYYIMTGTWAQKALNEAKKFCDAREAASSKDANYNYTPQKCEFDSDNAAYLHYTSNNTIYGTQFPEEPDSKGTELICDASSDFLHKRIDINKYGLIYAGAQKNLGPAGITVAIIKKALLERSVQSLPILMNYNTYVEHNSLYNTIPSFPVYLVGEVLKWIKRRGGLDEMGNLNRKKASMLYEAIDKTDFYQATAQKESRSLMNVTFRTPTPELDATFVSHAHEQGLAALKGHRLVGGLRASIYNAFPIEGVQKLVAFMAEFEAKHG